MLRPESGEKARKKKFKLVSSIDKKYLERTYEDMARKGWLLDGGKVFWDSYRPIDPCELEFSVTCFQPLTPFDYPDPEEGVTYQELCEDTGWTLATKDDRSFTYYKEKGADALPIHTDPSEEYRSVCNVLKKGELIIFPILVLMMVFQLYLGLSSFTYEDLYRPGGLFGLIYPLGMMIVVVPYMSTLIVWLLKNRPRAKGGLALEYPTYPNIKRRNRLYGSGLIIIFLYLVYSVIGLLSLSVDKSIFVAGLLNLLIIIGFSALLTQKIRKVKSKRSTNLLLTVLGFMVVWLVTVVISFSLVAGGGQERPLEGLPEHVAILTHHDLGRDLDLQLRSVQKYHTLLVPLSFEYTSYHAGDKNDFSDIEVTYIEARSKSIANFIAQRVVKDELDRIKENRLDLDRDGQSRDYVYRIDSEIYGLDMVYNLSAYKTRVMLVKENIVYIIQLDTLIDCEVLRKMVSSLFE